ncbi:hypothetical protein ACF1HU_27760 [Streptomyces olivaceus]|uniref:hypothetical protein n=1 Tax=Streptomyces olivaceus TaxID=47716 RepID=UPI0036ACC612
MTPDLADSDQPCLPFMRTTGELHAALTMGYGFPGDADDFEAASARRINHADPADLSGVVRLVEEYRGRVTALQDPAFGTAGNHIVPPGLLWATKRKHPHRCSLCTHRLQPHTLLNAFKRVYGRAYGDLAGGDCRWAGG